MKRRWFNFKTNTGPPPIFADLAIERDGKYAIVNVERENWLRDVRQDLRRSSRVGLVMRGETAPRVWVQTNGVMPEYLSRVIGTLSMQGSEHKQARVAGLICNGAAVWLHSDGLVEVQPEPTARLMR